MKENIQAVEKRILDILDGSPGGLPKSTIEEELVNEYPLNIIRESISLLLDSCLVDLVVDYPSSDSGLDDLHRVWHLKLLTSEEGETLRRLSPVKRALLKILRQVEHPKYPGEMPVKDVETALRREGFKDGEIGWLRIENKVDRIGTTVEGQSTQCYRIIPEDEKTEEYKRAMEEIHEAAVRKEAFYMYVADTHDLAHGILEAVRAAPEGISKKDIIGQLFRSDPDYLKEAFAIATEENEILPITLENGEDGYRINPEFYEEDW
ncbi:MAG: hypothetical protein JSW05_02290 [Candidatus Thorarchaeota archaeon]|nr:MAG: hypothetical protein JSW05_02290 [Candidatus Thorarchaeota archaeon]